MDLSEHPLEIFSENGDKHISFQAECQDSACTQYVLKALLFIHNGSKSEFFIKKTDNIHLNAKEDESDPSISFSIDKIDDDSVKKLKILKAGETVFIDISGPVSAQDWNIWTHAAVKLPQQHIYRGDLELFTTNTDVDMFVYHEKITLFPYIDSLSFHQLPKEQFKK